MDSISRQLNHPLPGFLQKESTMGKQLLNDLWEMITAKDEAESLKIQIRLYDEMVLSAEENLNKLLTTRDDLIYRLKELETPKAEVHNEATETETIAEEV
jgi:hypothetical protein